MSSDPLKSNFKNFLFLVWSHVGLPSPTRIQYDMAHYLQHGPRRKCIQAFRGVGKTWITAAYIVWRLYNNPDIKILVVSASKAHADNTTTFVLQIIRAVPQCHHLEPHADQREAKVQFDVGPTKESRDPSVKSVGIFGQITGSRADLIIPDDIETPENCDTQLMRDKIRTKFEELGGAVLKPDGEVVVLGTPQLEESLYKGLPAKGYDVRIWPARYPNEKQLAGYGDHFSPSLAKLLLAQPELAGKPTDPDRFSEQELMEREAEYARSGFALQFMLDTSPSDSNRYPLKLSDLVVMNLNPDLAPPKVVWAASPDLSERDLPNVGLTGDRYHRPMQIIEGQWSPYTGSVLAIDPSGRGKDETGYAVVKMHHGQLFLADGGGLLGGYEEPTLKALADIAKTHKVNAVIAEANFGDGMFTRIFQPVLTKVHPCQVEEVKHSIQKEKRIIDTLEPVMNQHRLIVDRKLIEKDYQSVSMYPSKVAHQYRLFHQLTRITRERGALRYDDRLDAVAIAVAYWVEQMSRDIDEAAKETEAAWLDEQVRKFIEHATGSPAHEPTWMDT